MPDYYTVTFSASNATVKVNNVAVTSATIPSASGSTLNFTVTPNAGYSVSSVTASNGIVVHNGGNSYTLSNVTANTTVTITTTLGYTVEFVGGNVQVRVNGVGVTSATVTDGGSLTFTLVSDLGYRHIGIGPSSGTVTGTSDPNTFVLTGASGATTVTISTQAVDSYWSYYPASDWDGGSGTSSDPFQIATAAQLAKLMASVNSGTSYSGSYFVLTDDIDLSSHYWAPIGGGRDLNPANDETPFGNYFAGTFDGDGYTISGLSMTIPAANSGEAAYGLFGYVKGGIVRNVSVSGSITTTQDIDAVGGVIGYQNSGSVTNCHNACTVSVNNSGASQTGGVVGVFRNKDQNGRFIRDCSNTGSITGRGRVGGILGSTYCANQGTIAVSGCFNTGSVTSVATESNCYLGGIVGYNEGTVSCCYNAGTVHGNGAGGIGGIAGIMCASISESWHSTMVSCFNTGTVYNTSPSNYVKPRAAYPLFGTADAGGVTVSRSYWLTGSATTQLWTNVTYSDSASVSATVMAGSSMVGSSYLNAATIFIQDTNLSSAHPVLIWQTPIYLNGTLTPTGSGTAGSPYSSLADAVNALTDSRHTILVQGAVTLSSGSVTIANPNYSVTPRIVRGSGVTGDLITVGSGATLTLTKGILNGSAGSTATGSLIKVNGGTFLMNSGKLTNNKAANGGAVYLGSGTFTMNGGTICENSATSNGAGVYMASGTTFNLGCSGIATNQVIYLANTSGASDAYITINTSLTSNLSIECANPDGEEGTSVANSSSYSEDTAAHLQYVGGGYTFEDEDPWVVIYES